MVFLFLMFLFLLKSFWIKIKCVRWSFGVCGRWMWFLRSRMWCCRGICRVWVVCVSVWSRSWCWRSGGCWCCSSSFRLCVRCLLLVLFYCWCWVWVKCLCWGFWIFIWFGCMELLSVILCSMRSLLFVLRKFWFRLLVSICEEWVGLWCRGDVVGVVLFYFILWIRGWGFIFWGLVLFCILGVLVFLKLNFCSIFLVFSFFRFLNLEKVFVVCYI